MEQSLLELLLSEPSVSGDEFCLQDRLEEYMRKRNKEVRCTRDKIGNSVYEIGPKVQNGQKKILLAAHIDEIGLMVTAATEDGFLKVTNAGGIKASGYIGHSVAIRTKNGTIYGSVTADGDPGVKKDISARNLLVDIGASTKEEALKVVSIGDTVEQDSCTRELIDDRILARGLDDKSGVYVVLETLCRIAGEGSNNFLSAAATVGEETTKHGARWVAEQEMPDEAIIVDVTYTSDYPEMRQAEWGEVVLGGGPAICINPICDKKMTQRLFTLAKEKGIPCQPEVSGGRSCTDADEIHFSGKGIPVALVSIPLRYMHSPAEVADRKDLEWCVQLLKEYVNS